MLKRVLLLSHSQDAEQAQDQESEVEETLTEETSIIMNENSRNSRH
jgi:hypothetical protein